MHVFVSLLELSGGILCLSCHTAIGLGLLQVHRFSLRMVQFTATDVTSDNFFVLFPDPWVTRDLDWPVPIEPPGDAGLVKKPKTHILGSRRPNPGPFGAGRAELLNSPRRRGRSGRRGGVLLLDRRQDLRQPGVNLGLGVGFGLARSGNFAARSGSFVRRRSRGFGRRTRHCASGGIDNEEIDE